MKSRKVKVYGGIFILLFFLLFTNAVHAQFLKNILNSAKNTAQSKANNAASNATNKALDKLDPTNKSNNNGATTPNSSGETDQGRVLGGFAKAAQDNPNDTSMSDILSKGLGNVMGGGGVSAADSAKALSAFKSTGNSGNTRCVYFEITNSIINDKGQTSSTTSKEWFTSDGRARGEMNLAGMIAGAAGYKVDAKPVVVISRANMRNYSVTLDDENKTYSLNVIDQALLDKNEKGYSAYIIGTETVNGYPCKHAVVKGHKMVIDMWMSTAVPGYDVYRKAAASSSADGSFMLALKAAGSDGFPVKIFMENSATSITLTKANYVGVSNSFFEIPSNYSKTDNNGIITNLMKAGQSGQRQ